MDLPFDGTEGINNFINSPAIGKYLHKHWVRKMPLWVHTGVSMIEKDSSMELAASNQGMEGLINNEKNLVTRMKTYLLKPAT